MQLLDTHSASPYGFPLTIILFYENLHSFPLYAIAGYRETTRPILLSLIKLHAENEDPHPQVVLALGLRMMNCSPETSFL